VLLSLHCKLWHSEHQVQLIEVLHIAFQPKLLPENYWQRKNHLNRLPNQPHGFQRQRKRHFYQHKHLIVTQNPRAYPHGKDAAATPLPTHNSMHRNE